MALAPYICVSGNLGSGKTTLTRALARFGGWEIVPKTRRSSTYLEDLFTSPGKWAFEAQVAFLAEKIEAIRDGVCGSAPFVVDRSPYEDIYIFAQMWADRGRLDRRAFGTYMDYARLCLEALPQPEAILYCECPPNICVERLAGRPRPYQKLYPEAHIEDLANRYQRWVDTLLRTPLISVRTDLSDFRSAEASRRIVREISTILTTRVTESSETQLSLFDEVIAREEVPLSALTYRAPLLPPRRSVHIPSTTSTSRFRPEYPIYVYIAAPFTARAVARDQTTSLVPFPEHGVIPHGEYRSMLSHLATSIQRLGYGVILPHRDVNQWGKKRLSPSDITTACLELVEDSDIVVAIMSSSNGAHFEVGVALAARKPILLLTYQANDESVFSQGMRGSGLATSRSFAGIRALRRFLETDEFGAAIEDAIRHTNSGVRSRSSSK